MIAACPCCKGSGWLFVYDQTAPGVPVRRDLCTHCMGQGTIATELRELPFPAGARARGKQGVEDQDAGPLQTRSRVSR